MSFIADYIGWRTDVNRIILDSSSLTFGDGAIKSDELDSGGKRTRLKSQFPSEKYSITMEFDWITPDSNGKTEFQRFYEWYKYDHKYGSVPFEFPKILYSPNTGIKYIDDISKYSINEYYRITSAVEGNKSGQSIQVKMTWESVYVGTIQYTEEKINSDDILINATNGYIDVIFNKLPETLPVSERMSLLIKNASSKEQTENQVITGLYFDNCNTLRIFFPALEDLGIYTLKLTMVLIVNGSGIEITKSSSFEVV